MPFLGCHLSTSSGFLAMGRTAASIGADTFQFFTRNPRSGRAKALDAADMEALRRFLQEHRFGKIVAHAPYTVNLCSASEEIRAFSREMVADDLERMELLPGNYYNFHPGSHGGQGRETGISQIADALNAILRPRQQTMVLLETMAGKGSEIGGRFEDLREILDQCVLQDKLGICLDTCHVYDGGYDLVGGLDDVLLEFDRVIGLSRLKAIHLNDSKNPFFSHKDRHEKLGQGSLGLETFCRIVENPLLQGLPMILETPNLLPGYAAEIALLRQKKGIP